MVPLDYSYIIHCEYLLKVLKFWTLEIDNVGEFRRNPFSQLKIKKGLKSVCPASMRPSLLPKKKKKVIFHLSICKAS
jgi:hypothetical protein